MALAAVHAPVRPESDVVVWMYALRESFGAAARIGPFAGGAPSGVNAATAAAAPLRTRPFGAPGEAAAWLRDAMLCVARHCATLVADAEEAAKCAHELRARAWGEQPASPAASSVHSSFGGDPPAPSMHTSFGGAAAHAHTSADDNAWIDGMLCADDPVPAPTATATAAATVPPTVPYAADATPFPLPTRPLVYGAVPNLDVTVRNLFAAARVFASLTKAEPPPLRHTAAEQRDRMLQLARVLLRHQMHSARAAVVEENIDVVVQAAGAAPVASCAPVPLPPTRRVSVAVMEHTATTALHASSPPPSPERSSPVPVPLPPPTTEAPPYKLKRGRWSVHDESRLLRLAQTEGMSLKQAAALLRRSAASCHSKLTTLLANKKRCSSDVRERVAANLRLTTTPTRIME